MNLIRSSPNFFLALKYEQLEDAERTRWASTVAESGGKQLDEEIERRGKPTFAFSLS